MSKIKVLKIAVIILILLNIALVVFIVLKKPNHPPHGMSETGPKNIIIERLHFDKNQIDSYEELINQHRGNIIAKEDELRLAKRALYTLLPNETQSEKIKIIAKITNIQQDIEEIHFNHFLDIKKLCKENQLEDYNNLTKELADLFGPPPMPKK